MATADRRHRPGPGYRTLAADGHARDIVAAPGAGIEERVGAALALRVAGAPDAQERIRVAAEQCADVQARAALEAVAAEEIDEPTIERALRTAASAPRERG